MKRSPLLILLAGVTPAFGQLSVTPDSSSAATASAKPKVTASAAQASHKTTDTAAASPSPSPAVHHYKRHASAKPSPTPTASPAATPKPAHKKRFSLFGWLFGHHQHAAAKATPTPAPSATPAPRHHEKEFHHRPAASPSPVLSANSSVTRKHEAKPTPPAKATPTPKPNTKPEPVPEAAASPVAKTSHKKTPVAAEVTAPSIAAPVLFKTANDKTEYKKVREQAKADPHVAALLNEMNAAPEGSDARKSAAHAFYKALHKKMRELDPSQTETIDAMERASLRRVDQGKPIVE